MRSSIPFLGGRSDLSFCKGRVQRILGPRFSRVTLQLSRSLNLKRVSISSDRLSPGCTMCGAVVSIASSNSPRRLRVFLCHAIEDKAKIRTLRDKLVADGFEPWLDESDVMPGLDWRTEIGRALRISD